MFENKEFFVFFNEPVTDQVRNMVHPRWMYHCYDKNNFSGTSMSRFSGDVPWYIPPGMYLLIEITSRAIAYLFVRNGQDYRTSNVHFSAE